MIEPPEIRYATTSDGLHIAYQVEGSGSLDLVETGDGTMFSIDATSEQPRWQQWVDRLASFPELSASTSEESGRRTQWDRRSLQRLNNGQMTR
jgi:hypothetical protein